MKINKLIEDIRFWIFIFFLIRLIGITNPPLEVGHNWRQTTVTMVARNYLEVDNNIFYPRIDIAGEKSGITGMEFPILNYSIYLVAEIFGYQHWYGRLINLIISSLGLWFFYKLILKYFTKKIAFYSTIILAVSIWFQFSRKIMPDTFSMSMIFASIYFGSNYLDKTIRKYCNFHLFGFMVLMILGVLSKIPSGFLFVIFFLFLFDNKIPIKRKVVFSIVSIIGMIPIITWYYYWVPFLVEKYEFWHFFMGKSFSQGISEILQNFNETLSRFYDTALKYIGFAAFLFGLVHAIVKRNFKVYSLFILTFISFSIIIFKAGYTFPHHNYYIIPFVPVMALIAGYGLSQIRYSNLVLILLISISIEGIVSQQQDFRIKEKDMQLVTLEQDLDRLSDKSDLIIINSGNIPTPMYFAHRKGWVNTNNKIKDDKYIGALRAKGLKYIVILKRSFGSEIDMPQYKKVIEKEDYCIYELPVSRK